MADDPGKEPLDTNTNDQQNPSDEIIPYEDTETITPIPPTQNMEVHKHPHNVTHPKKWSEYLLEFLMIFLAVTLGFIAENIHEHSLEVKATNGHLHTFRGELLHHKNVIRICRFLSELMSRW